MATKGAEKRYAAIADVTADVANVYKTQGMKNGIAFADYLFDWRAAAERLAELAELGASFRIVAKRLRWENAATFARDNADSNAQWAVQQGSIYMCHSAE